MKLSPDLRALVDLLKKVSTPHIIILDEPRINVVYFWRRKSDHSKIVNKVKKIRAELIDYSALKGYTINVLVNDEKYARDN
jgi:hypothetical protein